MQVSDKLFLFITVFLLAAMVSPSYAGEGALSGALDEAPGDGSAPQENSDLQLIPDAILATPQATPPEAKETPYKIRIFVEDELSYLAARPSLIVTLPDGNSTANVNRLSADLNAEADVSSQIKAVLSNRVNYFYDGSTTITDDLKELYMTGNWGSTYYLDAGRINVKNGVAMGFNPTDYFKEHAVSYRLSDDPSVLRENRLGTVLIRGQAVFDKGALSFVAAPPITNRQGQWWTDSDSRFLLLDRTNDRTRVLVTATYNVLEDFSPELLYYYGRGASHLGANVTKSIGQNIVAYAEWSVCREKDVISRGISETNAQSLALAKDGQPEEFRSQLATGFSVSILGKALTNVEYHFNGAGMSTRQWNDWIATGGTSTSLLAIHPWSKRDMNTLGQLWNLRLWSESAQEPMGRHYLFIRSSWEKAFISKLDLTALTYINLSDRSFMVQKTAEYNLNKSIAITLNAEFYAGSKKSEFGSTPQTGVIKCSFRYYF